MSELALFEHAKEAVAAAVRIDEVRDIRDDAMRARAYARIAKDRRMVADAQEIISRAERKLGILLRKAKDDGLLSQGGRPAQDERSNLSEPETGSEEAPVFDSTGFGQERPGTFKLADIGLDKKTSARAQKLAELDDDAFEAEVENAREKIVSGGATLINPRPVKPAKPAPAPKAEPLAPRRFHQFAYAVLALSMRDVRVSSEAVQFLAAECDIVELDGDTIDFSKAALLAFGSLADAARKAIGDDEPQPETAAQVQGVTAGARNASPPGAEGAADPEIILPATANGTMGGLPVAAASGTAEETGRQSEAANVAQPERPREGVTAGETAPSLSRQAEDAIIRAGYAADRPLAEMVAETGLTANVIKGRARRMGLSSRDRQRAVARGQMLAMHARRGGES